MPWRSPLHGPLRAHLPKFPPKGVVYGFTLHKFFTSHNPFGVCFGVWVEFDGSQSTVCLRAWLGGLGISTLNFGQAFEV